MKGGVRAGIRVRASGQGAVGLTLVLLLALAGAPGVEAQSVRITGSTTLRYVDVRPFVRDSVPVEDVEGTGLLRQTADGLVVRCDPAAGFCRGTIPGEPVSTIPAMQDLEVSAWGFGEGIRVYGHLRGRASWGGNPELWPRAEETVDLLAAYGELDRERYRIRLGRQWKVSGLGFYNFDGLAAAVRPVQGLSVEGYAGRSLVRGLNEPRTGDAVQAIEQLAPVEPGLVLGMDARYRPSSRLNLGLLYHRDIRDDRAGLYSELARADLVVRYGLASVEGSLEADLAGGAFNEARLRARAPPVRSVAVAGEVRRYRPYFELWTIWGAFSPVGFDEGRLDLTWARARGDVIVRGEASLRSYDDTAMEVGLGDFRTRGWGLGANASWSPRQLWRVEGGIRTELGLGAARSEGHARVVRRFPDLGFVALRTLAFERLYEFRLDHGAVIGLGAEGSVQLAERVQAYGGVTGYRHVNRGVTPHSDWTQLRGVLQLRWAVGSEPRVSPDVGAVPDPASTTDAPEPTGRPGS